MKKTIFWFRRDLRLHDNAGLYHALKEQKNVLPLFIFDTNILDKLEDKEDARVEFIHDEVTRLQEELEQEKSSLLVEYGKPVNIWKKLIKDHDIEAVYTNHDYESYAKKRDTAVGELLAKKEIPFHTYKDHVLFEKKEVVKSDGDPYVMFTPYSRIWKEKLKSRMVKNTVDKKEAKISYYLKPYPNKKYFKNFLKTKPEKIITLKKMGFKKAEQEIPDKTVSQKLIKTYDETRNFPARAGTSRLSLHFRFGTISIRDKALKAKRLNETYLNELIWRDFYAMILENFPHVEDGPFREKYNAIQWRNNEKEFKAWCDGQTGYPIVDAGMRELNATGFMHNRVRMITASFLTKHLLINWQWGEAYFAKKLQDFDLASNNGGWQWAAGTGTDAAPYFRIFNPYTQAKKFDKDEKYIKKWVPEYGTDNYVEAIVDHKEARERCLRVYKEGLDGK